MPEIPEGLPLLTEQVGRRHPDVGERQLRGVLHLAAHFVQFAAPFEAGHTVLDHQQAQPATAVLRVGRGARDHNDQVGLDAAGDERLRAVEHVVLAVANRGRPHTGEIRAGARFGHGDRGEQGAGRQPGEPSLSLRGVGIVEEIRQDHVELRAHRRQRHQGARRFLLQHHVVAVVGQAGAPVLLGDGHAQHPQRAQFLEHLAGHPAGLLPCGVIRDDPLLDEVAGQLAKRLVVVVEHLSAHQRTNSTTVALAVPPPSHIVCRPYRIAWSRMWCTIRVISTAPDAPSG